MRVGWCTPFNSRSSIALNSKLKAEALAARGYQVSILRSEIGTAAELPMRETTLAVHRPGFATPAWLRSEFDCVVYTLGDNFEFHGDALRLMPNHSGVVIIHDAW